MMAHRSHNRIKSVDRAMRILNAFDLDTPELSVSELSRMLGTHDSTASRLASTLASWNVLQRNPETGKYRLGVRLIALAGIVLEHNDLRTVARPYMLELCDLTQETINLTVLDGDEAVNVERVSGSYMVKNVGWVGRRQPLHCTAAGKVLLAYLPERKVRELDCKGLPRQTPKTIYDGTSLLRELRQVRAQGYGVNVEEFELGLNAVAAPIWNHTNQVEAALCVSGPVYRVTTERIPELGRLVKHKAAEVSKAMGHLPKSDRS